MFTSEVSPSLLSDSLTLMRTGWESPLLQLGQSGHPPPPSTHPDRPVQVLEKKDSIVDVGGGGDPQPDIPPPSR